MVTARAWDKAAMERAVAALRTLADKLDAGEWLLLSLEEECGVRDLPTPFGHYRGQAPDGIYRLEIGYERPAEADAYWAHWDSDPDR